MDKLTLAKHIDHTLLKPYATDQDFEKKWYCKNDV